jgi:hypothetical protein
MWFIPLDCIACLFDQSTVFHIRWTYRFAGAAAKAQIHLCAKPIVWLHHPIYDRFHQGDSTTRGSCFKAGLDEGGTRWLAEAATHAIHQFLIIKCQLHAFG